jgi:hypothetical protein
MISCGYSEVLSSLVATKIFACMKKNEVANNTNLYKDEIE